MVCAVSAHERRYGKRRSLRASSLPYVGVVTSWPYLFSSTSCVGEQKTTHEGQTNDVLFRLEAGGAKNERTTVILKDTQEVRPILR